MENIRFLIYIFSKVFVLIFGVILIISPNKMLNYFIKKDLEKAKDTNEDIDKNKLIRKIRKICKISGVYCVGIILIDKLIRNNALAVIIGYFIIPIIGLYILEKKFK